MTNCDFGDVVLVPFPFSDQSATKKRPAIVVSSAAYHRDRPDLLVLAVTGQLRPSGKVGERPVTRWQEAGLLKPSLFKPLIATIEARIVVRRLGRLLQADAASVREILAEILG